MKFACGRFRVDGRGAESRSKTWGARSRVTSPSTDGVGAESEPRNRAKQPRLHRWLLTARLRDFEREREQAAVEQGLILRGKGYLTLKIARRILWAISKVRAKDREELTQ